MRCQFRLSSILSLFGLVLALQATFPGTCQASNCSCHGWGWCQYAWYTPYPYPGPPVSAGQPTPGNGSVPPPVGPPSAAPGYYSPSAAPGYYPPYHAASAAGSNGYYAAPAYAAPLTPGAANSVLDDFDPQTAYVAAPQRGFATVLPVVAHVGVQIISDLASMWVNGQSTGPDDLLTKAIDSFMKRTNTTTPPAPGSSIYAKLVGMVKRVTGQTPSVPNQPQGDGKSTRPSTATGSGSGPVIKLTSTNGGEQTVQMGNQKIVWTGPAGAEITIEFQAAGSEGNQVPPAAGGVAAPSPPPPAPGGVAIPPPVGPPKAPASPAPAPPEPNPKKS